MIAFDGTITVGNLLTMGGMAGLAAFYFLDTRYSPKGMRSELRLFGKGLTELSTEVRAHMEEDTQRFDEMRREFGETIKAMREKINEVELFNRDTFIRRDSFHSALSQQQVVMGAMVTDLKDWMRRIEDRLNKVPIKEI